MNTIIFHPFNRVKSTPAHDISAALIAPVSKWYRKPTPWWVDGFEEVGLQPIAETDEIAEEEGKDVIEEQEELGAVDDDALEPASEGMTFLLCYVFCLNVFHTTRRFIRECPRR
jgi:hypothetical protein